MSASPNGAIQMRKSKPLDRDEIDVAALKALLRAALTFNATHRVKKSKGSRDI